MTTTAIPGRRRLHPEANRARAALAELIGTFLLVVVGTAVAVAAFLERETAGPAYDSLAIALAFGLTLTALVGALGQTSGCHVNPAVTLGLAVTGKFPWSYVPAYLGAQLVGGVLAALALWATYGDRARSEAHLGATAPAAGVSDAQAFLLELLIGFLLVFVVTAMATDPRVPPGSAAIGIGFALAACVLVAGPVSGGAANPARALGPMILNLEFPSLLSYVLGPIIGGILGAVVYDRVVAPVEAPEPDVDETEDEPVASAR
ncbi:aquaporin NIP [Friedmanniella luteola]|uniref:Aquaporin NIP n=1 Tax=Friedmanniella luteola TaxID=546871 RepID=A0A1H1ZHL0_9ACTN|nr:aquaporin [Friedmanniella luteola]SDT33208.1 aquaporin NIP [Friedmanniella luteola]